MKISNCDLCENDKFIYTRQESNGTTEGQMIKAEQDITINKGVKNPVIYCINCGHVQYQGEMSDT